MKRILILLIGLLSISGCGLYNEITNPYEYLPYSSKQTGTRPMARKKDIAEYKKRCDAILNNDVANKMAYDSSVFVNGLSWSGIIAAIQADIKKAGENQVILRNPSKKNMLLNAIIIQTLTNRKDYIDNFLEEKKDYYGFECSEKLQILSHKISSLMAEISEYSYDYERQQFQKKTGKSFAWGGGVIDLISSNFGRGTPENNTIYFLNGAKVMQSIPGGVLFRVDTSGTYLVDDGVGFLATSKKYADGTFLNDIPCVFTGLTSYTTILGVKKQIYAFKPINLDRYAKILATFYFYPSAKNPGTAEEIMPQLVQIKK